MKPYGRKQLHHNHEDNHPPKGFDNWWESEIDAINKKRERQISKKEIKSLAIIVGVIHDR